MKSKEQRDFIPQNARDGVEVSLRRPTHSQERMRKKKSACCVRNDGWRVGRGMRRPRVIARERGSSCTGSELWNNLTAPRHIASADFFLGPDWGVGRGERGCGRSGKWEVRNARLTQPARNCEWCAAVRVNQTGFD